MFGIVMKKSARENLGENKVENKIEIKSDAPAVVQNPAEVSRPVSQTEANSQGYFSKFRENPWILSTIILGVILLVFFFYGGGGINGNVIGEDNAAKSLISFIESQSNGQPSGVSVLSTEQDGQLYKVTVDYQGQNVPLYVSLDGKYLISSVIPLDPNAGTPSDSGADSGANTGTPINVEIGESPVKGKENAPVTIVEFSDYQCPYCGRFFEETLPSIQKSYIYTGKVKLVYKDFPLGFHENAQKAAEAARCVREQKGDIGYFKMHDKIYGNQESLSVENFKIWARSLGANGEKFDTCLDSGKFADVVKADADYGQSIGVSGTPAFFINGKMLSGAQPYSVFEQAINAALGTGNTAWNSVAPTTQATPSV